MARKKAPNWEDIKTRRTVLGESWTAIRKVYDVPLSTLKNRASQGNWKYEAEQIGTEIRNQEKERLKRILSKAGSALELIINHVLEELPNRGAYIMDGEGFPDKLHLEAFKEAVKTYLKPDEAKVEEEETKGFVPVEGYNPDGI